jgi:hypothetical protein
MSSLPQTIARLIALLLGLAGLIHPVAAPFADSAVAPSLWELAQANAKVHRFSTLFTAQDVRGYLSSDAGIDAAIQWCRETAVIHVFIETFRDGYQAEAATLEHARDRFRQASFEVSGCVTTTQVGKNSTGWRSIACYTDPATQDRIQAIFEFTARRFDEIMIDDFWFTDCACPECDAARKAQRVTVGDREYPVAGDTWEDYRGELMLRLSETRVLGAARKINPNVRIIIKYPQWYDNFHERGYDVSRETAAFDRIWVGTETRDYGDPRWGGTVQYEAYFIMRWLGGIGGEKCGGGWFDWLGTTEATYVEQARQTVLGGARESFLFCYGGLHRDTGPKDVAALRRQLPELFEMAREVRDRQPTGIAAYKPANSHPGQEARVFDFVGMLGLPLVPCHEFPVQASAAFFSMHALKDPRLREELSAYAATGRPVLLTDGLAKRLNDPALARASNVHLLPVNGDPKSLLEFPAADLRRLQQAMLSGTAAGFNAPVKVAFYPFADGSWVVENFNDQPVIAQIESKATEIPARGWVYRFHPRTSPKR